MQGKNNGERKNRVKKTEDNSCSLLSHFWSTSWSKFSTFYIPFQILGSQESNASNGVWIGAKMRKIWHSQDNYIRVGIPSGCRHFHPDVSHPEFGWRHFPRYRHLHPTSHPPPGWHPKFRIRMGKVAFQLHPADISGWEKRRFNFLDQPCLDPPWRLPGSLQAEGRMLHSCSVLLKLPDICDRHFEIFWDILL